MILTGGGALAQGQVANERLFWFWLQVQIPSSYCMVYRVICSFQWHLALLTCIIASLREQRSALGGIQLGKVVHIQIPFCQVISMWPHVSLHSLFTHQILNESRNLEILFILCIIINILSVAVWSCLIKSNSMTKWLHVKLPLFLTPCHLLLLPFLFLQIFA